MRHATVIALILLALPTFVQTQQSVIQFDYVATETVDGVIVQRDEGVHYFSPDGDYRHDRLVNGERTSEIRLANGERIAVNQALGVAVHSRSGAPVGDLALERPVISSSDVLPGTLEDRAIRAGIESGGPVTELSSIGVQARGPVLLHGYQGSLPPWGQLVSDDLEMWQYLHNTATGGTVPFTVESISTSVYSDGTTVEVATRLTNVVRASVPSGFFDVPAGVSVRSR